MVEIKIVYEGDLRCHATHGPSGITLHTDAPVDNNGKGESFSPTDLVATAMGTCMLTIMGILARKLNVDLKGTRVTVTKEMSPAPPRRIARLAATLDIPTKVSPEHRERLEQAALNCPVRLSVHPDIQMPAKFNWA